MLFAAKIQTFSQFASVFLEKNKVAVDTPKKGDPQK